jgi:hypothetical protein
MLGREILYSKVGADEGRDRFNPTIIQGYIMQQHVIGCVSNKCMYHLHIQSMKMANKAFENRLRKSRKQ